VLPLAAPPSAESAEHEARCKMVAAAVTGFVGVTLDAIAADLGLSTLEIPGLGAVDVADAKSLALPLYQASAEVCARKYLPEGLSLPYYDELVAFGGAGGCAYYWLRKMQRKKDAAPSSPRKDESAPSSPRKDESAASSAASSPPSSWDAGGDTLNVEGIPAGFNPWGDLPSKPTIDEEEKS